MAQRGRVQVSDLAPPERIQPAPLQSDTYAKPAQAPIDNSLEQLSSALGFFNKNLMAVARAEEADYKKAAQEEALARYSQYISATEKTKVYDDFVSGRTSFMSDPFTAKVAKGDYARMAAEKLAGDLDKEVLPWGTEGWTPEKDILSRAAPYVEKFSNDKDLMLPFRAHLDQIRSTAEKRHTATRGEIQREYMEDHTRRVYTGILQQAVIDRLPPQEIVDRLRKQYKDLGPRENGGLYGMSYKKQDELFLDTLDGLASDPQVAAYIPHILNADREDLNNAGVRLGSLAFANDKRARSIYEKSQKTLANFTKEDVTKKVLMEDVTALEANDSSAIGRFQQDFRAPNPFDRENKEVVIPKGEREKAAVEAFIARTGSDIERQIDVLGNHNIKHPTAFAQLEAGYSGFGGNNIKSEHPQAGTPQYEAILKGAQLYRQMADKNYSYVSANLSKEAIAFYETFNSLTRGGAENVQTTIAGMALANSNRLQKGGRFEMDDGQKTEFNKAADKIDINGWLPGGSPANTFEVGRKVRELAKDYVMVGGMKPADAIAHAADRIMKTTVPVNGRALIGVPGISAQDSPIFEDKLKQTFKENKAALAAEGIDDPSQLTVSAAPNGKFVVVHAVTGMPVQLYAYDDKGKPTMPITGVYTLGEIQGLRAAKKKHEYERAWKKAKGIPEYSEDPKTMNQEDERLTPFKNPFNTAK